MVTYEKATAAEAQPRPRKKRRLFLWFFLAVQILFLIWTLTSVGGSASGQEAQARAQAVSFCGYNWQGLYSSYADCLAENGNDLNATSDSSTAVGVGFVIALWVAADIILVVSYGVYRLEARERRRSSAAGGAGASHGPVR